MTVARSGSTTSHPHRSVFHFFQVELSSFKAIYQCQGGASELLHTGQYCKSSPFFRVERVICRAADILTTTRGVQLQSASDSLSLSLSLSLVFFFCRKAVIDCPRPASFLTFLRFLYSMVQSATCFPSTVSFRGSNLTVINDLFRYLSENSVTFFVDRKRKMWAPCVVRRQLRVKKMNFLRRQVCRSAELLNGFFFSRLN